MNALARIADEMAELGSTREERVYRRLCDAAKFGEPVDLIDSDLVTAIAQAVEWGCITTAGYGLAELQERMAPNVSERSAA